MKRRDLLKNSIALLPALLLKKQDFLLPSAMQAGVQQGPFRPDWASLSGYQVPEWYKNAKFGLWAHWGPQCEPEHGDWYARSMYQEGSDDYNYHLKTYGHPSKFGFKDVIHRWKAERWDPEELLALYKDAGAKYFVALANHHDNFDNYDSSYQPWNSVKMGPKKDLIAGWAKAARKQGLHFGVSVHAAHAWSWYEVAQRHDLKGAMQGIPYDGKIRKEAGKGLWWEGYDPQDLYEQDHALSRNSLDDNAILGQWDWNNGATPPSVRYCEKFYKRTIELIDKYHPDLLYFDDTVLPLWPVSDVGLRIVAHHYNSSIRRHGSLQAVVNGKILNEAQRKCLVWDIERGQSNEILPYTWQTDTCIGSWHYDRRILERHEYKTAKTVIHTLVDVVSKNGNLLLSIPVRSDGTIDSDEREIVKGVGAWMKVNSECIYDTQPWSVYGEGPSTKNTAALDGPGFNEGKGKPFTAEDIRFTKKGKTLYAILLGEPSGEVVIKTLKGRAVTDVRLLGHSGELVWKNTDDGLKVTVPAGLPGPIASVFKIEGDLYI
ncbi:MAG TPA: alpha-L-fucosidase [Puia sp.]